MSVTADREFTGWVAAVSPLFEIFGAATNSWALTGRSGIRFIWGGAPDWPHTPLRLQ